MGRGTYHCITCHAFTNGFGRQALVDFLPIGATVRGVIQELRQAQPRCVHRSGGWGGVGWGGVLANCYTGEALRELHQRLVSHLTAFETAADRKSSQA